MTMLHQLRYLPERKVLPLWESFVLTCPKPVSELSVEVGPRS